MKGLGSRSSSFKRGKMASPEALADAVHCGGRKLPRYLWYMVSGAICDVAQFFLDGLVRKVYTSPYEQDTVAWTVAYVLTIALRHETHRIFVFGAYEGSYFTNLGKMYLTYFTTITASIFLRSFLARVAEGLPGVMLEHLSARNWGYLGTVAFTGVFSYVSLKKSWGAKGRGGSASSAPSSAPLLPR